MTTLGTKHISAAFIGTYRRIPSNALNLCSRATNLFKPSSFTILLFWDSFSMESMVNDILVGYVGWKCMAWWNSNDNPFALIFCGFTGIGSGWAICVAFPDLSLKACSSRLVSLATSSLKLSTTFWCWTSNWALSSFSFVFFSNECYRWVSMGNLYFNLLNVNHAIYAKKLIKKKYIWNTNLPFTGWQPSRKILIVECIKRLVIMQFQRVSRMLSDRPWKVDMRLTSSMKIEALSNISLAYQPLPSK